MQTFFFLRKDVTRPDYLELLEADWLDWQWKVVREGLSMWSDEIEAAKSNHQAAFSLIHIDFDSQVWVFIK